MLNKKKAALPGCQCRYKELYRIHNNRPGVGGQSLISPVNTGLLNFLQWRGSAVLQHSPQGISPNLGKSGVADLQLGGLAHRANFRQWRGYAPVAHTLQEISPNFGRLTFNRGKSSAYRYPDIGYKFFLEFIKPFFYPLETRKQDLWFRVVLINKFAMLDIIVIFGSREYSITDGISVISSICFDNEGRKFNLHFVDSLLSGKATLSHYSGSPLVDFLLCLRRRRLISPLAAVTKNPAVLSPFSRSRSMSSITSWGILTVVICDFAFFAPVAITEIPCVRCISVYAKKMRRKGLRCISLWASFKKEGEIHLESAKPGSGGTLTGPLTKPLIGVTVMADIQSTQTHPKFTWRFLALNRHDKKARPCRLSVEAPTEREARRILAPHFILSLAARLPAPEVFS